MNLQKITGTLLRTNNYIVSNNEEAIIFEASADLAEIQKYAMNKKVLGIFLTHGHWDHSINIDKYVEMFNCKVFMHQNAFEKLKSNTKSFFVDRPVASNLSKSNVVFVQDGDVIDFSWIKIKCLHTPGHTNCSMCYLLTTEQESCLISGDTLFCDAIGRCDLPTSSTEEMINSLNKIKKLDNNIKVFPGHGHQTTIMNELEMINSLT